jgi:hypothetical protein
VPNEIEELRSIGKQYESVKETLIDDKSPMCSHALTLNDDNGNMPVSGF